MERLHNMEFAEKERKNDRKGKNGGEKACEEEKWMKQGSGASPNMLIRFFNL